MPKRESNTTKPKAVSAAPKRDRRASTRTLAPDYVSDEQIRRRAYELYLQRDAAPGDPLADWLRAEQELRSGTDLAHTRGA